MRSVCVFCGSSPGKGALHLTAAQDLARELGKRNILLVYGGGNIGIMGELANTALNYNVHVTGVIPRILVEREAALHEVNELIVVNSMHERKAKMSQLSDAFIAMPGGIGTLEELFEVWTWKQLAIHSKPIGLLNVDGYFDSMIDFLKGTVTKEFMREEIFNMLTIETDAAILLDKLSEQCKMSSSEDRYDIS